MFLKETESNLESLSKEELLFIIQMSHHFYIPFDKMDPEIPKKSVSGKAMALFITMTNCLDNGRNTNRSAYVSRFLDDFLKDPIPYNLIASVIERSYAPNTVISEILARTFITENEFIAGFSNKRFPLEKFRKECSYNNPEIGKSKAVKLVKKLNGKQNVKRTKEEQLKDPTPRTLSKIEDFTDDELKKYHHKFNWKKIFEVKLEELKKRKDVLEHFIYSNPKEYIFEQLFALMTKVIPYEEFKERAHDLFMPLKKAMENTKYNRELDKDELATIFFVLYGFTAYGDEKKDDLDAVEMIRDAIAVAIGLFQFVPGYPAIRSEDIKNLTPIRLKFYSSFLFWTDSMGLERAAKIAKDLAEYRSYDVRDRFTDRLEELAVEAGIKYRRSCITLPSATSNVFDAVLQSMNETGAI